MCKFCDGLFREDKEIIWSMRNNYADDNFCEKVLGDDCEKCEQCKVEYRLKGYKLEENDNCYMYCSYKFDNGDILMWNSTETLQINYCPYCGKQLSKNMINFDDIGDWEVDMIDPKTNEPWDYQNYLLENKLKDKPRHKIEINDEFWMWYDNLFK